MIDLLLQMGLSNACFALALALAAMVASRRATRPHLAHLLWLLVFVRLVTPPLATIPVGVFSLQPDPAGAGHRAFSAGQPSTVAGTTSVSALRYGIATLWNRAKPGVVVLWLSGSAVVLMWSMARICRFGRLLAAESDATPRELQEEADRIALRLGLAATPTICTTAARLSPMVWWAGRQVQIVVPRALLDQMDVQDWRWILAHELAHVRRRDYLVRWVEWLACVCFWWNPVVWWAQRRLRAAEEICCDDLVLSCLHPAPKSYAASLFSVLEFLARPVVHAPAMASEINSGGSLERRFRMIISEKCNRSDSRWSRMCVLVCALAVLPLGMASAQDYKAVGKRLQESVDKGEITRQQADTMMAALKEESTKKDGGSDKVTAGPTKVKKNLGATAEAGKISKKDAAGEYGSIQKGTKEKMALKKDQDSDKTMAYLMEVKKDLGAAVEAGKISKEDAARKFEAAARGLKEKTAGRDQRSIDLEAARKKLRAKVRAGELTQDQAIAEMSALKKAAAKKGQELDKATPPVKVKKDLGAAVEGGKISKEDAAKPDMKKKTAAKPDYDAIGRQLKAAVQAGKLTKEEAKAKWEAIKKETAGDNKGD